MMVLSQLVLSQPERLPVPLRAHPLQEVGGVPATADQDPLAVHTERHILVLVDEIGVAAQPDKRR